MCAIKGFTKHIVRRAVSAGSRGGHGRCSRAVQAWVAPEAGFTQYQGERVKYFGLIIRQLFGDDDNARKMLDT